MLRRLLIAALSGGAGLLLAACDQSSTERSVEPAPVVNRAPSAPIAITPNDRVTRPADLTARRSDAQPELPRSVPGELLVKFKPAVASSDMALGPERIQLQSVTPVSGEP